MLSVIFDDKRLVISILFVWLSIVLGVFSHLGIWNTAFMSVGPSEETQFMNLTLNTWFRWSCVAVFTFLSTTINDFSGDAIGPWIQNTLQDHKTKYLPYSKLTCWFISQFWAVYCSIMSVFSLFVMMSQIDFLLIRAFADVLVNSYTTWKFIRNKRTSRKRYEQWYEAHDDKSDTDGLDNEMQSVDNEMQVIQAVDNEMRATVEQTSNVPAPDNA